MATGGVDPVPEFKVRGRAEPGESGFQLTCESTGFLAVERQLRRSRRSRVYAEWADLA